jgi:glycosyltransferase involved in cell wall biosynthesis
MKIAQVAPLIESVPPRLYGGTERVVSYLTEELVRQGHEVTLFASGDSVTSAELVACSRAALRLDQSVRDVLPYNIIMLEKVRQRSCEFDVIHFHTDYLHFPLMRAIGGNAVTTLHGRLDLPDLDPLYREFKDTPVVSISLQQRTPLPDARWVGNVYHGLPLDLYPFVASPSGGCLVFLGRICPEKRPDRAVETARRVDMPLKIAAKVDMVDEAYFRERIRPLLSLPNISYLGEVGERAKAELLGNAEALLFPVDWPEPFGLTMIEAMACGTPVIAWRRGSVTEVVEDGVTGFIVDDIDGAVTAIRNIGRLDRARIRRRFEQRFGVGRMAEDYLSIYESLRVTPFRPTREQSRSDIKAA